MPHIACRLPASPDVRFCRNSMCDRLSSPQRGWPKRHQKGGPSARPQHGRHFAGRDRRSDDRASEGDSSPQQKSAKVIFVPLHVSTSGVEATTFTVIPSTMGEAGSMIIFSPDESGMVVKRSW